MKPQLTSIFGAALLAACETGPDFQTRLDQARARLDAYCQQASPMDCRAARQAYIRELEDYIGTQGGGYAPPPARQTLNCLQVDEFISCR